VSVWPVVMLSRAGASLKVLRGKFNTPSDPPYFASYLQPIIASRRKRLFLVLSDLFGPFSRSSHLARLIAEQQLIAFTPSRSYIAKGDCGPQVAVKHFLDETGLYRVAGKNTVATCDLVRPFLQATSASSSRRAILLTGVAGLSCTINWAPLFQEWKVSNNALVAMPTILRELQALIRDEKEPWATDIENLC